MNSHNQNKISYENHLKWFINQLKNTNVYIYIVVYRNVSVGTVRKEWSGDCWIISWTVSPACRGKGYGTLMVKKFLEDINGIVKAEVKLGNIASQKIAEKAGLEKEVIIDDIIYFSRKK